MKRMNHTLALLLAILLLCSTAVTPIPAQAASSKATESIDLEYTSLRLPAGGFFFLNATAYPAYTSETETWTSSNPKVVKVIKNGKLQTLREGAADITVRKGKATAVCHIVVDEPCSTWTYDVKEGTLDSWYTSGRDQVTYRYIVDTLSVIRVKVTKEYGDDYRISVKDDDGMLLMKENVKASLGGTRTYLLYVPAGIYAVTLTADDMEYVLDFNMLIMEPVPVKSIRLSQSSLTLAKGEKEKLSAVLNPDYTTDDLYWSSSNSNVAYVSSKGVVKGIALGQAKISAICGEKTKRCKVLVNQMDATVITGKSTSFTPYVKNIAKYTGGTWSVADKAIAGVTADGTVTGKKTGSTNVYFKAPDGTTYTICTKVQTMPVTITAVDISYYDDGDKYVEVVIRNRTNQTIDRIDFDIIQYDRYGNKLKSPLSEYWYDQTYIFGKCSVTDWIYWVNDNTARVVFVIKKVKFDNGKTMTF